jgi:hypothetical protein
VVEGIVAEAEVEAGAEAEEATVAGVVTSKHFFFLPRHHNKSKEGGTWCTNTHYNIACHVSVRGCIATRM